ncbi:MAG: glycerol-3-phosphate 1-O-acyltransferase PlsY [Actinobacteria bacterium]|nr:glycerol-3-phosphate 1-O-acyltransferase PlsY [Actinomycetota bacterium]
MLTGLLVLAGYLAGSMPFGYWLVRATKGVDIRAQGSGNIGASNVWRTYGARYGAPVALLDVAKGFGPALAASLLAGPLAGVIAGGAAMAGHWRPVFLRFAKGGKMVATCGGAFFGVAPLVAAAAGVVWLGTFLLLRYASVASMTAAVSLPILALVLDRPWPVVAFAALAAVAVFLLHRGNIRRLREGTERRFSFRTARRRSEAPAR